MLESDIFAGHHSGVNISSDRTVRNSGPLNKTVSVAIRVAELGVEDSPKKPYS